MRTVPIGAVETLLCAHPHLLGLCAEAGVSVGARVEVDLAALPQPLADVVDAYAQHCARLWSAVESGTPAGLAYVVVARPVAAHRQNTSKANRADLEAVFGAASGCPELSSVLDAVTDPEPPTRQAVAGAGGVLAAAEDGRVDAVVTLTGSRAWPAELGGVAGPGEIRRHVTLSGRHAAWRDRRVRRLAAVSVEVEELWADPAPFGRLLNEVADALTADADAPVTRAA